MNMSELMILDVTISIISNAKSNVNVQITEILIYIPFTLIFSLFFSISLVFLKLILFFYFSKTFQKNEGGFKKSMALQIVRNRIKRKA